MNSPKSDLFKLAIESRGMFPLLSESLMNETGIDIQFQDSGLIKIAHSKEDVESLRRQYNFLKQNDPSVKQLSPEDLMHLTNGNVKPSYARFISHMMAKSTLTHTPKHY